MGCNCGKNRKTRPLGVKPQQAAPPPAPKPAAGQTQSFTLQTPTGTRTTYGSRLEAEAARIRNGGQGTIR